jgi:hypothetical protein
VEHALGPVLDLAGGATVPVRAGLGPADPAVIDGDQSHETCADAIHSDDLEATIQGGLVSLDQIIEAHWRSRPECNPDAAERQRFLRCLPELERLYDAGHGGAIKDTYFSRHILAGVVLTADHEIHLRYPPESVAAVSPEFEEAIWRCTSLSRQGFPDMDAVDRTTALRMLHSLAVYLLGVLDAQHAAAGSSRAADQDASVRRIEQSIVTANSELDQVASFIDQAGRRTTLRRYTQAMPWGVFLVVLLGWVLSLAGSEFDRSLTLGILAAGGVGAVISVMARITRGKMEVDPRAGGFAVRLSGAFRPVLGAVFGVALYVVVMSGLMPVAVPEDETTRAYFFYTLAFLAGFSERLAQDVFTAAEQTLKPAARAAQADATVVPRRRRNQ